MQGKLKHRDYSQYHARMAYEFPSILYRFQRLSADLSREKQLFLEHQLYFESPRNFNDPFDSKPFATFSRDGLVSKKDVIKMYRQKLPGVSEDELRRQVKLGLQNLSDPLKRAEMKKRLKEGIQSHFDATTMKCFSENRDGILQWSHYGDSHRGYGIGFALEARWVYSTNSGKRGAIEIHEVTYSDDFPSIDLDARFESDSQHADLLKALSVKSTIWRYENEWRALRVDSKPGLQDIPEFAIKEVIFGASMPPDDMGRLRDLLKHRRYPVNLFQSSTEEGKFALRIEPLGSSHD